MRGGGILVNCDGEDGVFFAVQEKKTSWTGFHDYFLLRLINGV